ncbi:ferredoxin-type protein [Campylobacter iguaniorum]|uniref:hypothetical protein n=1 Tax=Campylobacter iguaniorum TaxID=1244531 RepID=UPI00073A4206|nr:hypothetical protein [Campylobacter iguaniorum]ALV24863.1 ferredoxin-type protein [Campylobacter iguaniorum]
MPDLSKRALFGKILGANEKPQDIMPPYFGGKFDCLECDLLCIKACHRDVLIYEEGRVKFDTSKLGCDFCKECANVCPNGVLSLENPAIINAKTFINVNSCLAWNDVICYNCYDVCKFKAIEYFGVFRPVINQKCVNCGECLSSCFKSAISMSVKKD